METKAELRAHYLARRNALPEAERAAAASAIAAHLGRFCRDRRITRLGAF